MLQRLLTGLVVLAAALALAAHAQDPRELNFGILSTESSQNLKQDWQPLQWRKDLFREKTRLEADANLPAGERAAKLDAINRKLAELQRAS